MHQVILEDNISKNNNVEIVSIPYKIRLSQKKNYIFDKQLPYWILYRNFEFDELTKKIELDCFETTEEMVTNIKILEVSEDVLKLDFNGEIREFKKDE